MKKNIIFSSLLPLFLLFGCAPKPFLDQYKTETRFVSEIGNLSIHTIRGFELDNSSNMYMSGTTFGSIKVCDTTYRGGHAGIMMKLGSDLNCRWSSFFAGKLDRSTCFLREAILDKENFILVPGICHGELHINGIKQFEANGKFQSFITKMDSSGMVIWTKEYFLDQNFIITNLIKTSKELYTGIGIKNDTITVLFEIDTEGTLGKTKEFNDPAKIYNNIILERGSKLFQSSIGEHFVSIRELDAQWKVDWKHIQDTKCSLMPVVTAP